MVNAERMTRVDPITLQPLPVRDIKIAFDEVGSEIVRAGRGVDSAVEHLGHGQGAWLCRPQTNLRLYRPPGFRRVALGPGQEP